MAKRGQTNPEHHNISMLVEVARLYYEHRFSQQKIAKKMGISRPAVSRLLNQARKKGIVQIDIVDHSEVGRQLEDALQKKFLLKKVIVISDQGQDTHKTKQLLGAAAAAYLETLISSGLTVGISWGSTVLETVRQLQPRHVDNLTIVQLIGGISRSEVPTQASDSALKMAEIYKAVPYLLPLPAIVESAQLKQSILTDKNISRVLQLGRQAEIAVFSVGDFSYESVLIQAEFLDRQAVQALLEQGAVGEICSRVIRHNGEICSPDLDQRTIGIELAELKNKNFAIAVAGGESKMRAILAGLRGSYCNVLITDELVAGQLIREDIEDER